MRCAVLGDPIDHSLSPVIHRAAYAALGLDGWQYDAVQVPSGGLAGFVDGLDPTTWRGLSLTMPLKREAVPLLGSYDEWVGATGACNTRAARAGRQPARAQHRRDRCAHGAGRARRPPGAGRGPGRRRDRHLDAAGPGRARDAARHARGPRPRPSRRDRACGDGAPLGVDGGGGADRRRGDAGRRRAGVDRARVRPGPRPGRGGRRRPARLRRGLRALADPAGGCGRAVRPDRAQRPRPAGRARP